MVATLALLMSVAGPADAQTNPYIGSGGQNPYSTSLPGAPPLIDMGTPGPLYRTPETFVLRDSKGHITGTIETPRGAVDGDLIVRDDKGRRVGTIKRPTY
ncbi:MAG: hypothetical protein HYR63_12000 [Proteobacteria bacterium]|nr:hypothetical protein [Pseudomonadota bacterium]MBI3498515.1 hypothetical protein [Pseudomonadota bacterium]